MAEDSLLDGLLAQLGAFDETVSQVRERLGLERRGIRETTAERRLALAMIELAINDLLCPTKRLRASEVREAEAWVRGAYESGAFPDVSTWDGCCETLGLDPSFLRSGVLAILEGERRARFNFAAVGDGRRANRRSRHRALQEDP